MNGYSYDTWLFEPYEKHYNELEKHQEHLEQLCEMEEEEDQQTYCDIHGIEYSEIKETILRGRWR